MKTTLIKKRGEMRRQPLTNCHDGEGALDWTNVLDPSEVEGRQLHFLHDDVLAPGVSIGLHTHDEEEYYYIISPSFKPILKSFNLFFTNKFHCYWFSSFSGKRKSN